MTRHGKMRLKVFVEGDTEKNYFSKLRKSNDIEISYIEINMHGGGYKEYLKQVKKKATDLGVMAVLVVVDLDKYVEEPCEKEPFKKLHNFCKRKNKNGRTPYFLIASNRSFEYFACLHCPSYKDNDVTRYIEKDFNYKNLDKFKSDKKVYEYLNRKPRSFINALEKLKKKEPFIKYEYEVKKKKLDMVIKVNKESLYEEACSYYHSNLDIFFDIIGLSG